jgi:hypothetical protein
MADEFLVLKEPQEQYDISEPLLSVIFGVKTLSLTPK